MSKEDKLKFIVDSFNKFIKQHSVYSQVRFWHVWKDLEFVAEFDGDYKINSKFVYTDKENNKYELTFYARIKWQENTNADGMLDQFLVSIMRMLAYAKNEYFDIVRIINGTAKLGIEKDSKTFNESVKLSKSDKNIVNEINKYYEKQ